MSASRRARAVAGTFLTRDASGLRVVNVAGMSRGAGPPAWLLAVAAAALAWLARRAWLRRHLAVPYARADLKGDIAAFYDTRSAAWESVWGEHMHHGLYDVVDGRRLAGSDAQVRTMSELLRMGGIQDLKLPPGAKVLDVGCGIGGASRYLGRHFGDGVSVTGITLSPLQAERATQINKENGLEDRVTNIVANALDNGFPDKSFDVVWSMESGEHMENKYQFLQECTRVLKPGGHLVMLAWCVRECAPPLRLGERYSIRRIMEEYCLPRVAPASEYNTEMVRAGLRGVQQDDWTSRAAPFWGEVARSAAFDRRGWAALRKYGRPLIRSAIAMRHVIAGIRKGVFKLVAFAGRRPTEAEAAEERERRVRC